jgi:hypothetical protein
MAGIKEMIGRIGMGMEMASLENMRLLPQHCSLSALDSICKHSNCTGLFSILFHEVASWQYSGS